MSTRPLAGLQLKSSAVTLNLTTTPAKLISFSSTGGSTLAAGNYPGSGDASIVPDRTNNRVLLQTPGKYKVTVNGIINFEGANDYIFDLYINGAAVSGARQTVTGADEANLPLALEAFLDLTRADAPGTLGTFSAPSGEHAGGAGAPKTMTACEIYVSTPASTGQVVMTNCTFVAERIDV